MLSIPPIVMMIRVVNDYDILNYNNAWIYTCLLTPILLVFLIKASHDELKVTNKIEGIIIYTFFSVSTGFFVFFGSVMLNCTYDNSEPIEFGSEVLNKRIRNSRSTSYLLTIPHWKEIGEEVEVEVSERLYKSIEIDDDLDVYHFDGLLNVPWFYVLKGDSISINNDILLEWKILDNSTKDELKEAFVVINSKTINKTIQYSDSILSFWLAFEDEYSLEFGASGFNSKTMLFNTNNVPEEFKQYFFELDRGSVNLIPIKETYYNDTVAKWSYSAEEEHFSFIRTKTRLDK